MMKGTHGFKTCFPAPRNRQYYNKDYKNKPQQQLEQSSRSSLLLKNHQTQDRPTSSSTSTKKTTGYCRREDFDYGEYLNPIPSLSCHPPLLKIVVVKIQLPPTRCSTSVFTGVSLHPTMVNVWLIRLGDSHTYHS